MSNFFNNFININIVVDAKDAGRVLREVITALSGEAPSEPEPKPEPEPEEEEESSSEEEEEEEEAPEEGEEAKPEEELKEPPAVEDDWRDWDRWIRNCSEEYIKQQEEREKIHNEIYEYSLDGVDWVPPPPPFKEEGWKRLAAWARCYGKPWVEVQRMAEKTMEPPAKRQREWWCGHRYEIKKEK